jgi:hypothetical protein
VAHVGASIYQPDEDHVATTYPRAVLLEAPLVASPVRQRVLLLKGSPQGRGITDPELPSSSGSFLWGEEALPEIVLNRHPFAIPPFVLGIQALSCPEETFSLSAHRWAESRCSRQYCPRCHGTLPLRFSLWCTRRNTVQACCRRSSIVPVPCLVCTLCTTLRFCRREFTLRPEVSGTCFWIAEL